MSFESQRTLVINVFDLGFQVVADDGEPLFFATSLSLQEYLAAFLGLTSEAPEAPKKARRPRRTKAEMALAAQAAAAE